MAISPQFIKAQIDSVRRAIGRNVTLYYPSDEPCGTCVASGWYDALNNESWNSTCPECHGTYWIPETNEEEILARVHWAGNEGLTATPVGKYFLGDAQITVDTCYHESLQRAQSEGGGVRVDGQDFQILRINPLGAPTVNRVRAILRGKGERPE